MKVTYDQEADALYIYILDPAERLVSRTVEFDPGTLVDLDHQGRALGIELIRPARPWPMDELFDRFGITDPVASAIRALFPPSNRAYPFSAPAEVAGGVPAAATG